MIDKERLISLYQKYGHLRNKWRVIGEELHENSEAVRAKFRRMREKGIVKILNSDNTQKTVIIGNEDKRLKPDEFWGRMYELFESTAKALPQAVPPPPRSIDIHKRKDEEEFGLLFSDLHIGTKTSPEETGGLGDYNWQKFKEEMAELKKGLHSIFEIHFSAVPYKTINVFSLGDIIENQILRPSQLRLTDMGIVSQVMGAVEEITAFLYWLAGIFPMVNIYAIPGNHDRLTQEIGYTSPKDSFEYLIWAWIKERLANCKNVKINVSNSWFMLVERLGWTFYIEHGDEFFSWLGLPFYGQQRGKMRIREMLMNYINERTGQPALPHYFLFGHTHIPAWWEGILVNGGWTGVTEYTGKRLKKGTPPAQVLFSIHQKQGITFVRNINLEQLKTRTIDITY